MVRYEPAWASLERHRAPEWYRDAKFGLFVHYSPAWFGEDGSLPVPVEGAAASWAELADRAGASYVVFTTKHHDGFCNWPSAHGDHGAESFGGSRDVVTPLVEAARRRGLKVGFYYSWLDNHHPDYPDREAYVREYAHEQLRELIDLYEPSVLWGDGEWDHTADHWGAEELLARYYNWAAENGRDVCVNDRLGVDTRYYYVRGLDEPSTAPDPEGTPRGDYWTPEHQVVDGVAPEPFEACETTHDGWSWTADANWRDPGDLVALLIDVVSKNGNLLLNAGPKPDGTIDDRERERFAAIGDWLAVNGEAIYGTRPLADPVDEITYAPPVDWEDAGSTWAALTDRLATDGPLRLTRRGDVAYAIHVGWPGDRLSIEGLRPRDGATVELLGVDDPLDWHRDGDALEIRTPDDRPCEHAYAFRIPLPIERDQSRSSSRS